MIEREFYGVIEKVYPDLFQHIFVAAVVVFVEVEMEFYILFRPFFFEKKYAGADLFGKIEPCNVGKDSLIFDFRKVKDIRRHIRKAV